MEFYKKVHSPIEAAHRLTLCQPSWRISRYFYAPDADMHHGGGRDRGCWGPGGTGCRNRMGGTGFQERENREEEQDCVYVYATFLPAPQNIQGLIFRWIIGQWEARQRGGLHCVPQLCRGHMPLLPIAVPLRPSWEDCPLLSPSLKAHICILSHQPWPLSYSKIFSLPSTIAMGEVKLGFVLPHSTWMASIWRVKPGWSQGVQAIDTTCYLSIKC